MTEIQNDITYAGFWRRFAAYWIDYGIVALFLVGCVTMHALYEVMGVLNENRDLWQVWVDAFDVSVIFPFLSESSMNTAALTTALIIAETFYFTFFEASVWQATPGKRLMNIRVMDYEGHRLEFPQALGRNAGKLLSNIIFSLGYLLIAITHRKQALHDRLAKTVMVRT